ncbi:MAG: glycosyltransferase family 4 protein [Acidobacteriota bacterium]|nr:glycosyltransferase family 4 protein [Acidobacteriota bacterium]
MKILLCKSHFAGHVSGSDETLVAYATHLHKGGCRITIVLLYPPSKTDQYYVRLKDAGVEVITITSRFQAQIVLRKARKFALWFSRFNHLPTPDYQLSRKIWQRTSQWISNNNTTALANAMTALGSNPELKARMGRAARARYEELFSPQVVLPTLLNIYNRIASKKAKNNVILDSQRPTHPWAESTRSDLKGNPVLKGRRIIFVLGSFDIGGAERQALILAKYLSEKEQANVEVWGFDKLGPVAKICEEYGLGWRVISNPFSKKYRLNRAIEIVRFTGNLRAARPDILLPYTLMPNVVCGLVWKWTRTRLFVWNQRDEGIERLSFRWENRAVRQTPQFISNSQNGARFLADELKAEISKISVIDNGVEYLAPEKSRFVRRNFLQVDDECFVACMVGNLHKNKDHRTLLIAWCKVATVLEANGRRALLILAGEYDDSYESLVSLSNELGINHCVRFLGFVSDIPKCLSAVDVGVFSSRSEGCPNGVLESMAAGLAVAGTNIEGIREALGPAGTEFLAPPGDAVTLAEIILKLANNPTLCSKIGAENQNRIRNKYDSVRMCEETISLLAKFFPEKDRLKPL